MLAKIGQNGENVTFFFHTVELAKKMLPLDATSRQDLMYLDAISL